MPNASLKASVTQRDHIPPAYVGACVWHDVGKVMQNNEVTRMLGFVFSPRGFLDTNMLISVRPGPTRKGSHSGGI